MRKIAVLIPTRERLDDFIIFAESWRKTTQGFSDVIVGVDYDDITYEDIKEEYPEFIYEYGPRMPFLHVLNKLAVKYAKTYDYVGFMEDDCNFVTVGWEKIFMDKIDELGDYGIVWGNDLVHYDEMVGLPFMSSKVVNTLGFICPIELQCLWADFFWKDLGDSLGSLHYFNDVIVEHRHHSTGKRSQDIISSIVDAYMNPDKEAYLRYKNNKLALDVQRLKNA